MKYLMEIHHGIGDIVKYTGLIKSVRSYDKDAFIALVLNKDAYKSLFAMDNSINEIYVYDVKGSKAGLLKTIVNIRKRAFDYMVCSLHSSQKSMEFMAVAFGARMVAGTRLSRLSKISNRYINISVNSASHEVIKNFEVLTGFNLPFRLFEPYLLCPKAQYKLKEHTVGLCIGTSIPHKTWPLDRYIAVGEALEKLGYSIVLIGGKMEQKRFENYRYQNERWLNLLGKTDLLGTVSECKQCELIIGGDTGVMYLAAAVGTKTLTLFSCSEPTTNAPYSSQSFFYNIDVPCQFCYGTERMQACQNYVCIEGVETNMVVKIAEGILCGKEFVEQYRLQLYRN